MNYKIWTVGAIALTTVIAQLLPALSAPVKPLETPTATSTKPVLPLVPVPVKTVPAQETVLLTQTGQASWYGYEGGSVTATGERYNPQAMTAAHRTLAFGSKVRVINTRTGKSAIVIINDRGPFIRGRIIDLSQAAAEATGIRSSGVGNVRIEVLSYGSGKRKARR